MRKVLLIATMVLGVSYFTSAQDDKYAVTDSDYSNDEVEMADGLRSSGKIYVVVTVILVIFAGISFHMYSMDRKLSALEKKVKERSNL